MQKELVAQTNVYSINSTLSSTKEGNIFTNALIWTFNQTYEYIFNNYIMVAIQYLVDISVTNTSSSNYCSVQLYYNNPSVIGDGTGRGTLYSNSYTVYTCTKKTMYPNSSYESPIYAWANSYFAPNNSNTTSILDRWFNPTQSDTNYTTAKQNIYISHRKDETSKTFRGTMQLKLYGIK